jgi:hypothetical protein
MQEQYSFFNAQIPFTQSPRNDVRTGDAAEAFVIAKLLKWGFDAHDARRDLPYDVVVDIGRGRICRIQVKGRNQPNGGIWQYRAIRGNWRSATGTYAYTDADYNVSAFVALSVEKVLFVPGVVPVFKASTANFLRSGAEEESWSHALAQFRNGHP